METDIINRTYRTLGKKTLDPNEEWTDVTDESDLDAAGWRFLKAEGGDEVANVRGRRSPDRRLR